MNIKPSSVDFPSIESEKVKYNKYRVKIEYYKDIDDLADTGRPTEVVCADVITTVLDNQQVIDPVLRNQYENLLRVLHDKLGEESI